MKLWVTLLRKQGWRPTDLAQELGRKSPPYDQLACLAKHSLAKQVARGHWQGCKASLTRLNEIAEELGVSGTGDRRQKRHQIEREGYESQYRQFLDQQNQPLAVTDQLLVSANSD